MCFTIKQPKIPKIDPPSPAPAVEPLQQKEIDTPESKPLYEETDVARVEYGTQGKKAGVTAKSKGASQLRIPLNKGTMSNAAKLGVNK